MLPQIEGIEIPKNVIIKCALVDFKQIRANKCESCEHFDGIAQMNARPFEEWHKRFVIRCRAPIERRTEATEGIFV